MNLLRLLREVKEYKTASLLAPLLMAFEVVLELMLPLLMSFIIDQGVTKGDLNAVLRYGGLMLLSASASLLCGALSGRYAAYASAGFVKNLREAMFRKIQDFSFANIDRFSTSGLVTRMMTDATNVQESYQIILRLCVRAPLMLIVAMFLTFMIHAQLALVFLVAMAFLALVLVWIVKRAYPTFQATFAKYDDLNASVQENITNIREVKAYAKEPAETAKFVKAAGVLKAMFTKAELILVINNPAMQLAIYGCILALSWFGAHFIVVGSLTTGELMSMFTYTMNILMSLMMLSMIFVMLSMSLASAKRIVEILDAEPTIKNPENPITEVLDGAIRFEHVDFGYYEGEDKLVLKGIDLEIKAGETIGILGSTGSSKTSLINLIPRLYDVSAGHVSVGGVDVRDYDLKVLRDAVAVVLQKNVLFSGTILENLRWGNEQASREEVKKVCELASADGFIMAKEKQYDDWVEQGGSNFSGGQKQRLCIARALLKQPKVLILDDSTSAVDTKTDRQIRNALRQSLPGTTKLIIAQRIASIMDADRIVVLDDGVIVGVGTHDDLLATNDLYRLVAETQLGGVVA